MTVTPLKTIIIQANPTVGDLTGNLNQMLAMRERYADADLLVFSECFLTGYPLHDLATKHSFITAVQRKTQTLSDIMASTPGPAILFGAPTVGTALPYNSAILIRPDGTMAITHKQELPNSGVFDEKRIFMPGSGKAVPMRYKGWNLGVMICEDGWHAKVADDLASEGADLLISINGSPCKLGKLEERVTHMRRRVASTGLPLIYCNQVGAEGQLVFDGASFILNEKGDYMARMAYMQADALELICTRSADSHVLLEPTHTNTYRHAVPCDTEIMYRAGMIGLRDYCNKTGIERVFVGNSGGKDSAAVLTMAVDALGSDRVVAVMMPSRYTSQESLDLGTQIAFNLGCRLETVSIDGPMDAYLNSMQEIPAISPAMRSLAEENVQARIRMTLLMAYANLQGGIMLGTSNKSEAALGYGTTFGDIAGMFNPIKDLYATDVWAAMEWRNTHLPVDSNSTAIHPIPKAIISRPPSAELKPGQSDVVGLGASYEVIATILKALIEDDLDTEAARHQSSLQLNTVIEINYVAELENKLHGNEFKRCLVSVPGPQIRPASFGLGRRYPLINRFRTAEEERIPA